MKRRNETQFDPTQTHPAWNKYLPSWQLNRDFAQMHEHILREGKYLDRFGKGTAALEGASQYAWRTQASFALDCCSELVDLRVGNLFRTSPVRSYDSSPWAREIDALLADVDGAGTSMDDFMRNALRLYYVNGVDLIVDKSSPALDGGGTITRADEIRRNARAFLTCATPIQRVDWSCDHTGRYRWVRYHLGAQPRADEADQPGPQRYLTLTPQQWRLYRVSTAGGERTVSCATGEMSLGTVPVIGFYFRLGQDEQYGPMPLSLLTRISPVARALLNLLSQGQLDIYMAIGILAATGIDPQQLPREIAPMCWLAFPEGASIEHIRPAVEHIREKRAWAGLLMEQILRMGKLTGIAGGTAGSPKSGFQVQVERTDLDSEMASTAKQMERVETEAIRLLLSRQLGRNIDPGQLGYSVEYNKRFALAGVSDLIEQARQFASTGAAQDVPELWKLFLHRILDAVAGKSDPRHAKIREALDTLSEPAQTRQENSQA
jgi:hypothetical protein